MDVKTKPTFKSDFSKMLLFVLGLFFLLLALGLILDIGYVARTFAFPFVYLFGFAEYFIYGAFIYTGLYLIFRETKLKIHNIFGIFGYIVLTLGASIVLTINLHSYQANLLGDEILTFPEAIDQYNAIYQNYYANVKTLFLYQGNNPTVGGGLIGYTLVSLLDQAFTNEFATLVFGIVLIVLGACLIIVPLIYKLVYSKKKNSNPKKKAKEAKEETPAIPLSNVKKVVDRSEDTIASASLSSSLRTSSSLTPKKMESTLTPLSSEGTLSFIDDTVNVGGLTKAKFKSSRDSFSSSNPKKAESSSMEGEDFTHVEQMHFGFEDSGEETSETIAPKEETIKEESATPSIPSPIYEEPKVIKPATIVSETKVDNKAFNPLKHPARKFMEADYNMLFQYETTDAIEKNTEVALERQQQINTILANFKIGARCSGFVVGPAVTRYNISYDEDVSIKSVANKVEDLALRLGGVSARFVQVVPGEPYSGLEIPNAVITIVGFKEVLENLPDREKKPLAVAFGKEISGKVISAELDEFPHLLVAGTTGSGKSIFVHSLLLTLMMRNNPDNLQLVLIDPKKVEFGKYKDEPHLLTPIITEANKAKVCLNKLVDEMERRYTVFEETKVSNIKQFNKEYVKDHPEEHEMSYIVAFVDEYADLVDACKEISQPVVRIAQKARAAGIHLVIATQRPSTNVVTGTIKGNLPTHVAFCTSNYVDSCTILGEGGAETLLGKGDSLVQSSLVSRTGFTRVQACLVQNCEINQVVSFMKRSYALYYDEDFLDLSDTSQESTRGHYSGEAGVVSASGTAKRDERYEEVKSLVMKDEYCSISKLQREFGFGFGRAGRVFSMLQDEGIVAPRPDTPGSSKGCRVLVHDEGYGEEVEIGSSELTSIDDK